MPKLRKTKKYLIQYRYYFNYEYEDDYELNICNFVFPEWDKYDKRQFKKDYLWITKSNTLNRLNYNYLFTIFEPLGFDMACYIAAFGKNAPV